MIVCKHGNPVDLQVGPMGVTTDTITVPVAMPICPNCIADLAFGTHDDMLDALTAEPRLCEDCPPVGYPTDKTRCSPCPRRRKP